MDITSSVFVKLYSVTALDSCWFAGPSLIWRTEDVFLKYLSKHTC